MGSALRRPTGRSGRRRRHRHQHRSQSGLGDAVRPYGAAIIALLVMGLGGVAAWYALEYFLHSDGHRESPANTAVMENSPARVPPWEQDVLGAFDDAAQQVKGGNITGAEVQVDEAVAKMEEARVRSKPVPGDFFDRASAKLDSVLKANPVFETAATDSDAAGSPQGSSLDLGQARLFQHVTQARVELATMRSWQQPMPAGADLAVKVEEATERRAEQAATNGSNAMPHLTSSLAPAISSLRLPAGHVDIEAPRDLSKDEILDSASLHATFLDASLMPDTSEILLPPESRQLSDNVRVENLAIAGASQTLDGIRWHNVTFIGTRLRYEDGPLDLQNVRFIQCTFGFPSDARGAAIANTIALGKTSLTIR